MTEERGNWLDAVSRRFAWRAKHIYRGDTPANSSLLYAHLSQKIAQDRPVLRLLQEADPNTQVANLLFGAVHYLLAENPDHPLIDFYPSLSDQPRGPQGGYPLFRTFCLENADRIVTIVTTKKVQTNEVGRCTAWLPALAHLAGRHGLDRFHMIELGASAGLHQLMFRFGYRYGPETTYGSLDSLVQLECEVSGATVLPGLRQIPIMLGARGLDVQPVRVTEPDEAAWLLALIWPEQTDRRQVLMATLELAKEFPPLLVAGDMTQGFKGVLERTPAEDPVVVLHSYTFNQCPPSVGKVMIDQFTSSSEKRELYELSLEWYDGQDKPHLELGRRSGAYWKRELLAYCESHGRWIEWRA